MDFISDFIVLITGLCLSIAAALFAFIEKRRENKEEKKSNINNLGSFIVIVFGAILTCVGGLHSIKKQEISDAKAEYLQKHADSLNNALLNKQNELSHNLKSQKDTLENVLLISQKLNSAQEEVIDLQKNIYNQVLGDKGIPIIFAFGHKKTFVQDHFYVDFSIINKTKYPIYGIALRLVDLYEVQNNMERYGDSVKWTLNKSFDLFEVANHYFDYNVLYPEYKKTFYSSDILIKPDLQTDRLPMSYEYTIRLLWAGKYACTEKIILKPNDDSSLLYMRQINFELNGKKTTRYYADTMVPLHNF